MCYGTAEGLKDAEKFKFMIKYLQYCNIANLLQQLRHF